MVIGSLWLPKDKRDVYKKEIHAMKEKHKIGPEFKWQKVSNSRLDFYLELVDWFCGKKEDLRFRCIGVDKAKVDLIHYHENDQELGFYKFYYQMLHHWISDFNEYSIFCDSKNNARRDRLHTLATCLINSNLSATIKRVQSIRSHESVLIQMSDFLTGMAASRLNNSLVVGSAREKILRHFEKNLGRKICGTNKGVSKFNVFLIDLQGGW
jgi:hypothetical protein